MNTLPEDKEMIDRIVDGFHYELRGGYGILFSGHIKIGRRIFKSWDAFGAELLSHRLLANSRKKKISLDPSEKFYSYSQGVVKKDDLQKILQEMHSFLYECEVQKVSSELLDEVGEFFKVMSARVILSRELN